MAKTIPCFICGIAVELHNETAIAALCEEHRTAENVEKLKNTPTHQLLRILNDGVKQELDANKVETASQLDALKAQIAQLEEQIANQETVIQETPPPVVQDPAQGSVNEWGEVI